MCKVKYTRAVLLNICHRKDYGHKICMGIDYLPRALHIHPFLFCPGLKQTLANTHQREGSDSWIILPEKRFQNLLNLKNYHFPHHVHYEIHIIQLLEFPLTFTYQTYNEKYILRRFLISKVIYYLIKCQLPRNYTHTLSASNSYRYTRHNIK